MDTITKNKLLNITLWISQFLLAAFFFKAGYAKATMSIEQLNETLKWTQDAPEWLVRLIGICEFAGSIGLILPSLLHIKPILTPIAACGLILIMILAILFHIWRGEANIIRMHFAIILIGIFIAWGRFKKVPIFSKANGNNRFMMI